MGRRAHENEKPSDPCAPSRDSTPWCKRQGGGIAREPKPAGGRRKRRTGDSLVLIDFSLQQLALRLAAYIFIAAVHGLAVAAAAYALGDAGPRHDGRLSVNPLVHLDVLGTAAGVLFSAGWIRPIAIDPGALRAGRAGLVLVVAAGFAATVLSAVALLALRPFVLPLLSDSLSPPALRSSRRSLR
jgi:hypothetical protein